MSNLRISLGAVLVALLSAGAFAQNPNQSIQQDRNDIRKEKVDIAKDRAEYNSDQAHITALDWPAVLEVAGVRDILTKSMGSANVLNVVMATFDALYQLRSAQQEAARRGKKVEELLPFWERRKQHA